MNLFLASIILGIFPMVVYALIVWRLDRWETEPFPLLVAAFAWGAVPSILFGIIAQQILGIPVEIAINGTPTLVSELYQASLVAPITEELLKGCGVLLIFIFFHREIDSILDGLIYGSIVGFGFSAVENIIYFLSMTDPAGLFTLFFLRAIVFGMLHALFTGLIGVGFALGKFSPRPFMRVFWPALGLFLAILTHGLHNYFATIGGTHILFAVGGVSLGIFWFLTMVVICLIHENRWIRIHLSPEVDDGILYPQQALDAAAFWTRSSLSAFREGLGVVLRRKRLLHLATELAFKKQKNFRLGSCPVRDGRIVSLREEVKKLSREDPLVLSGAIETGGTLPPPLPPTRIAPSALPS